MTPPDTGKVIGQQAMTTFHRGLVVIEGDQQKALIFAASLFGETTPVVLSQATTDSRSRSELTKLMGQEISGVLVDAHQHFDPDLFGILAGALCAGCLLVILVPDETREAPENSFFLSRIQRLLRAAPESVRFSSDGVRLSGEHEVAPEPADMPFGRDPALPATSCQQRAVDAVVKVVTGRRRRPTLLIADRGRGKSAALGIAAGQLLAEQDGLIFVTSHGRASTDTLFRHATASAPELQHRLEWRSVEELLALDNDCLLLLVDEAASIPVGVLEQLIIRYPRLAMATTVHGYEGSGRGFVVRFGKLLEQRSRGSSTVLLKQPVRWSEDDPVEKLTNRLLILDAEAPATRNGSGVNDISIEAISRQTLVRDEPLLRSIFSLLVLSHYKTRPRDLRELLDNATGMVYVARSASSGAVVGVLQVTREGGLPSDLARQIARGSRRPPGQMLAESLASLGDPAIATLDLLRIARIVVEPDCRRSRIGARLLQALAEDFPDIDLIGSSFALSADLIAFWRSCGFDIVNIGRRKTVQSGSHSSVWVRPTSEGARQTSAQLVESFNRNLPGRLSGSLRSIDPGCVVGLLGDHQQFATTPPKHVLNELASMVDQRRDPDEIPDALQTGALHGLATGKFDQPRFIVERVLLGRAWSDCSDLTGDTGWRAGTLKVRDAYRRYLDAISS